MEKENIKTECCKKVVNKKCNYHNSCNSGAIYGLGVVGALFYFLGNATSFTTVMIGIGKSIFWPAILMFKLLTELGM